MLMMDIIVDTCLSKIVVNNEKYLDSFKPYKYLKCTLFSNLLQVIKIIDNFHCNSIIVKNHEHY